MKFVIATGNENKVREFREILAPLGIETISSKELGVVLQREETGETFAENAKIKAWEVFEKTGLPTIADDSGLCVDALKGAPGVHSARYGGESLSDKERYQALLQAMKGLPVSKRTARFVCHITCIITQELSVESQGTVEGTIAFAPQGTGGFGYDPVFLVGEQSFSQLSPEEKNKISHRGHALRDFVSTLTSVLPQYKENL